MSYEMTHRQILIVAACAIVAAGQAFGIAAAPQRGAAAAPPKKAPAAAVEKRVPYLVGEQLSYDVSWSSYLTAGVVTLRVEAKKPSYGSTAYYVTAEAQTTGVVSSLYSLYYKADTLLDSFSLLPQRGSVYSREGRRERLKITQFDHAQHKARFQMKTASLMTTDVTLPPLTQDLLSAVYVLRAIQPRTGDRLDIPVTDSGKLYTATFVVGGVEQVKKADGTAVAALRVTPDVRDQAGKRTAAGSVLWLSNDAALKPVRMEASLPVGRIVLALK